MEQGPAAGEQLIGRSGGRRAALSLGRSPEIRSSQPEGRNPKSEKGLIRWAVTPLRWLRIRDFGLRASDFGLGLNQTEVRTPLPETEREQVMECWSTEEMRAHLVAAPSRF